MNLNKNSLENISTLEPGFQLARLGGNHGYRFDGDIVHLDAMFTVVHGSAHETGWALQLWACPTAPAQPKDLKGHLVAEVELPPIGELADETENFEVSAPAFPPAGQGEHVMVLGLASGRRGQFNEVHDMAVYARREQFVQPRMQGRVAFTMEGQNVRIEVERIENPRPESNLSGTLSLELWALPAPYTGGAFKGVPLAGQILGTLAGQNGWDFNSYEMPMARPSSGTWHITLMLREWTTSGYVTLDFTNFTIPVCHVEPVSKALLATAPVAPTRAPSVPVAPSATLPTAPVNAGPRAARAEQTETITVAPAASAKVEKRPASGIVSINTASVEELSAVKGMPTRVAERIIAGRPFSSLEGLLKVKGMGAKLLARLRSRLGL